MVSVSGTYSRPEGLSHCSTYPDAASLRNSEMHCPLGLKEAQSTIWKRANTLDFQRRSFKEQLANPHATMAGVPDHNFSSKQKMLKNDSGKSTDVVNTGNEVSEGLLNVIQILMAENKYLKQRLQNCIDVHHDCSRSAAHNLTQNSNTEGVRKIESISRDTGNLKRGSSDRQSLNILAEDFRSKLTGNNQMKKSDCNLFNAKQNPGSFKGTKLKLPL